MVSLIPDASLAHLRDLFGVQVDALDPAEVQALATAEIERVVSNARLQELLADHPVDITRMLTRLCEKGLLVSDNRRRWTTYRLGGDVTSSPSLFDEAGEKRNSLHKPGDLSHKQGDLSHKRAGELTPEEEKTLSNLAERVSSSRRAKPEFVRQVLLEVCAQRYLTADQMARLLHRNVAGLRTRYLYPMTGEGLLRLRYPESPNRPDQAYISVARE
jgi:ATP-dependent DNA helicase RecG